MEKVKLEISLLKATITERIVQYAKRSIKSCGVFSIALSGGNSPRQLLADVAKGLSSLSHGTIHVLLVDERYVPSCSADSNLKMITECFLTNLASHLDVICHSVNTELSFDSSVEAYRDDIDLFLSQNRLDITILGVGEDGHVASLFELPDSFDNCCVVAAQRPDFRRVSLSYGTILGSKEIYIFAPGESKRSITSKAESFSELEYPVQVITSKHEDTTVFVTN